LSSILVHRPRDGADVSLELLNQLHHLFRARRDRERMTPGGCRLKACLSFAHQLSKRQRGRCPALLSDSLQDGHFFVVKLHLISLCPAAPRQLKQPPVLVRKHFF